MKMPKVIHPENHDTEAEAQAAGADIGVCSCPVCGEYYASLGDVIECECGFQFPVDWWPQYSWGSQAGHKIAEGGIVSGGMKHRCQHPYYRFGFENPVVEAWNAKDAIDWKAVMQGVEPKSMGMFGSRFANCDRCGKVKPEPRGSSSQLCIECEAETRCAHYAPDGPTDAEYVCTAGIKVTDLTGTDPGWVYKSPCRFLEGGCPVACGQFAPTPIEQIKREDAEWQESLAKFMLLGPLVERIKAERKGTDWKGVEECPACKGKLHLRHSGYNGHLWGQCETEGCYSWME